MSLLYLAPPRILSRKQINTELMHCKSLFIVHFRVKGFLKGMYWSTKRSTSVAKVGVAHAWRDCVNAKFQVPVQINEVLLYNKKINKLKKNLKRSSYKDLNKK